MPVIPAAWEMEMGGSQFKKLVKLLSQKNKLGMMAHAFNSSYWGGRGRRITV
jgi:hypothetical protein